MRATHRNYLWFAVLTGAAGLLVVLQGVWAGIFLAHDGARDDYEGWIDVHARGADIAIVLSVVATILALVRFRSSRSLWIGAAALVVALILESYLGGLIRDDSQDSLTVVHIPLAMIITGLAVWLPIRSGQVRRSLATST